MPIYEYECAHHGVFELERAMSLARADADCPSCSARSRRILSTPRLSALPRATRVAHERNEQSQHEPRAVSRPAPAPSQGPPPLKRACGPRPWVIEHA